MPLTGTCRRIQSSAAASKRCTRARDSGICCATGTQLSRYLCGWCQGSSVRPDQFNFTLQLAASEATTLELADILSVKTQVVAGTNYQFELELTNGLVYDLTVFGEHVLHLQSFCQLVLATQPPCTSSKCDLQM